MSQHPVRPSQRTGSKLHGGHDVCVLADDTDLSQQTMFQKVPISGWVRSFLHGQHHEVAGKSRPDQTHGYHEAKPAAFQFRTLVVQRGAEHAHLPARTAA